MRTKKLIPLFTALVSLSFLASCVSQTSASASVVSESSEDSYVYDDFVFSKKSGLGYGTETGREMAISFEYTSAHKYSQFFLKFVFKRSTDEVPFATIVSDGTLLAIETDQYRYGATFVEDNDRSITLSNLSETIPFAKR